MPTRKRPASGRKGKAQPESRHPLKLPRGRSEAAAIKRLRAICLALPEVTEKIAWGEPTWRAGKIFAQKDTHHHGGDHVAVGLPAPPGVQEAPGEEEPVHFVRAADVGHKR